MALFHEYVAKIIKENKGGVVKVEKIRRRIAFFKRMQRES